MRANRSFSLVLAIVLISLYQLPLVTADDGGVCSGGGNHGSVESYNSKGSLRAQPPLQGQSQTPKTESHSGTRGRGSLQL
ncbi:unnamed protein product [Urochloa humidicola]